MAIETICEGCSHKLRVDDQYAGRQARCPRCRMVYTVPVPPGAESSASENPGALEPTSAGAGSDQWLVRTEEGALYGPTTTAELNRWVEEGRVTPTTQLKREPAGEWQSASAIFPSLQKQEPVNPFAGEASQPENPYAPTAEPSRAAFVAHRGGLVLTLGLVGVICCQLISPAAWVMGQADLRRMDSGEMDPAGRGSTQAGMVLGIVGSVLLLLGFAFQVFAILVGIAFD